MMYARLRICFPYVVASISLSLMFILVGCHSAMASENTGVFFLADFTQSEANPYVVPSGSAWRGYVFQVRHDLRVTHLIGGGTVPEQFACALLTANLDHVGNPSSPGSVLAQVVFPDGDPGQAVAVTPVTLTASTWYYLAQGRIGTSGAHHLLSPLDIQSIRADSPLSMVLPDSGYHALSFAGVTDPQALSGKSSNSTSDKPAVGFMFELDQRIEFHGGAWQSATYGDGPIVLQADACSSLPVAFLSSDTSVATVEGDAVNIRGAGATVITAYQAGGGAWAVAEPVSHVLTVSPRGLSVSVRATSKTFGELDPEFFYDADGLLAGDEISGALERHAGEDVGEYTIHMGTLLSPPGYLVNFEGAPLTIEPRPLSIVALPGRKIVGEEDPMLAWQQVDGTLVEGDLITGELVRDPGESIGVYGINLGSLTAGLNYLLDFVPAHFTIQPRPVSAKPPVYYPFPWPEPEANPAPEMPQEVEASEPQSPEEPETSLPPYILLPSGLFPMRLPVGLLPASDCLLMESVGQEGHNLSIPTSLRAFADAVPGLPEIPTLIILYVDSSGELHHIYEYSLSASDTGVDALEPAHVGYLEVQFTARGAGTYMCALATEVVMETGHERGSIWAVDDRSVDCTFMYLGSDLMMSVSALDELGMPYAFDVDSGSVAIRSRSIEIELRMNSPRALLNGEEAMIVGASGSTLASLMAGDRMMIPLRFTLERLGYRVDWTPDGRVTVRAW